MERVAPQWSNKYKYKQGADENRVPGIDVVATIPRRDELQWLDVTFRRPTAVSNVEFAANFGGFSALQGEERKTRKYRNWYEIGPDKVKPISFELGGRPGLQTINVLRGLTTKLADARGPNQSEGG